MIIRNLRSRPWRFNELQRDLEGISQKVLTDSLRQMIDDGLVYRNDYHENPPRVDYGLTDLGKEMMPIIDALADAGVRAGLPRKLAVEAAAQTLYGAAKMVLETGKHPAELRDGVTSPGGTTIAGIHAMEARGIRAALMDAVMAALAKSDEMGRK